MNLWQQNYDPAGNIWLSSLIASLPILFFFFALIKLKLKGYVAASWTVVIALTVALLFYKMPVDHALASVGVRLLLRFCGQLPGLLSPRYSSIKSR
jgi:L-lactate permease